MNSDKPTTVEFYCHVRKHKQGITTLTRHEDWHGLPTQMLSRSFTYQSVDLEFHGDLQLMTSGFDVKVQGCVVRAYSCLTPQPGLVVYPWGNGTASSCPYEDGANVLVDAELVPFVRADFKSRCINLWSVNSSGQLIRWE